ncbi:conjugal transfer protein TraG N-terminal domain-containing protein [Pseudomonas sp. D3-10]|uniref:conjugal transfer protein TraG N-terminal domain-containing protein n=1 Tax=Pseudomonas sp. D3-10 TaxID=2817392 RepID=UPI003DA92D54
MDFTIYTTGSAEFLEIMLNACAMITGSGDAEDLARIGALIGLFLLAFQAVFNNQAITFGKAGLVLVLYMMFYGPTATTVIEDTVSSQVRVVDNVPLGPAFVGSVISTVAYGITKTAEQAFSTPSMTDYGLFSSLSTLSKVRDALRNPMALDGFQNYRKADGWDLPRSVNEYMTFCSLNPVALRTDKTLTDLYRSPGWAEVLSNQNSSMFIYVYDGTAGTMKSCAEARSFLNAHLQNVYTDVLEDILQKGFSEEAKTNRMTSGIQVQAATDQAIQSLALSSKSAQDYVLTSLIAPIFNDSRVDAMNHWQEQRAAMALRESLNQQEIQWAGKGDSFKHYMRPMIAFFEGMLYAMTPFMAFALLLGGPGLSILGKYLVLPLAVGLWMPLLSIVNAFTLWYAGSQMEAVFNGYDPTGSGFAMLQLMDIDKAIGKALGIGGLLAASVPPLALFIVSGSAMVANSVMSQMAAGDKFKSEDVTPRAQNSTPVLTTEATYASDQLTQGVSVTGQRSTGPQLSAAQGADAMVQSSRQVAETATSQVQETLQAGVQQLASTSSGMQTMAGLGSQVSQQLNLSSNSQYSSAARTLESNGISKDEIAAGTFAASSGVAAPFGLAGTRLEQSEKFQQMSSAQQNAVREAASQLSDAVQSSSTEGTTLTAGDTFMQSSQATEQTSTSQTLAKSLSNAKSANEAYQIAAQSRDSWAQQQNLDLGTAAGRTLEKSGMARPEAARAMLDMAGRTASERDAIRGLMQSETILRTSTDQHEQQIAASTLFMMQQGRLGELVSSNLNPFDFNVATGNANANAGLSAPSVDSEGLASRYNAASSGAGSAYAGAVGMASDGYASTKADGALVVSGNAGAAENRVAEHSDMSSERLKAQEHAKPLSAPDIDVATTTPVSDTASHYVQDPISAIGAGAGQLVDGAASLAGAEPDNAFVQSARNAFTSPVQAAKMGAAQISDSVNNIAEKILSDGPKSPKID